MSRLLYENHRGSPTLTFLNVLGVLNVLHELHVLNMPMDASLACWALFFSILASRREIVLGLIKIPTFFGQF